jgi:hypothetical protein
VAACSGKCGREGQGPFDSGDPALDARYSWCDPCYLDLAAKRMPPGLVKDLPAGTLAPFTAAPPSAPELNSLAATEHKIMPRGEAKTAVTIGAGPVTGSGTFSGYLAGFGRDHGGDTIMGPAAVADSVKAVNEGRIVWHLTDGHSAEASAIVATVTSAVIDASGVRVQGVWAPTQAGQALREMTRNGQQLGLSIDYYPVAERPDGQGGRYLDKITIVGGAITPRPMNSSAVITEGKFAASVPVVGVYDDAQARHADPDRDRRRREDEMLAAAAWPPPSIDRESRLALIRGAAEAKARRELAGDPQRAREQARRDQDNRYCLDLAAWMAANR